MFPEEMMSLELLSLLGRRFSRCIISLFASRTEAFKLYDLVYIVLLLLIPLYQKRNKAVSLA